MYARISSDQPARRQQRKAAEAEAAEAAKQHPASPSRSTTPPTGINRPDAPARAGIRYAALITAFVAGTYGVPWFASRSARADADPQMRRRGEARRPRDGYR